jgi:LytS/YehU family sensor histidine kinase
VDEDPSRAKMAITQLSNILRNSLVMDKKKVIAFKDEMQTVKDYLNLEFIRFEERLQTRFHIHPDSNLFEVPPLMIQTLVENGIKHGVSNLVEGGLIQIETDVRDGYLYISIKNSGQLYTEDVGAKRNRNSTGYGLANTRQRLDLIYGDKAAFSIKNLDENFVLTELRIPQRI